MQESVVGQGDGKAKRGRGRTPVMEQFFRAKEQYPDALLFFRMGDFYEFFYDDAVHAAQLLDQSRPPHLASLIPLPRLPIRTITNTQI